MKKKIKRTTPVIDPDYLHGVCREVYIEGLVRGGTSRDRIPNKDMTPAKIDSYCNFVRSHVRATILEMAKRGDVDIDSLKPLEADKKALPEPKAKVRVRARGAVSA